MRVISRMRRYRCKACIGGARVGASGWSDRGDPRFQSHPRLTSQSCSRYQLNQLGSNLIRIDLRSETRRKRQKILNRLTNFVYTVAPRCHHFERWWSAYFQQRKADKYCCMPYSFPDLNLLLPHACSNALSINCFSGLLCGNFLCQYLNVLFFLYLILNLYVHVTILSVITHFLKSLPAPTSELSLILISPFLTIFSLLPKKPLGNPLLFSGVFSHVMLITWNLLSALMSDLLSNTLPRSGLLTLRKTRTYLRMSSVASLNPFPNFTIHLTSPACPVSIFQLFLVAVLVLIFALFSASCTTLPIRTLLFILLFVFHLSPVVIHSHYANHQLDLTLVNFHSSPES